MNESMCMLLALRFESVQISLVH